MEALNVLYSRKSIRTYTGQKVSVGEMKEILKAAKAAPVSLGKYDTVHLTVVENTEILKAIDDNLKVVFQNNQMIALYGAPTFVIVSVKPDHENPSNADYSNAAIITQNMSLAAVDMGVGCCHIWGAAMAIGANQELIKELNLPEGFVPCCGIALGETTEQYTMRDIPEDRVSLNYVI